MHEVRALRGVSLDDRARRVRGGHRAVGLGQVHVHAHRRLPRPADERRVPARRPGRVEAVEGRAGARPEREDRLRVPGLQPAHANHGARQRRTAAALPGEERFKTAERHKRALAALDAVGLGAAAITTCRTSFRAASSSASRLRARWSTSRRSSWPTSRPATSTRAPASRSWASSSG